jgi:hypothetical protein
MLTAATRTNNGLPWQQQRRTTPGVSQIRKVAKSVREGEDSTWHDSMVCHVSFVFYDSFCFLLLQEGNNLYRNLL